MRKVNEVAYLLVNSRKRRAFLLANGQRMIVNQVAISRKSMKRQRAVRPAKLGNHPPDRGETRAQLSTWLIQPAAQMRW